MNGPNQTEELLFLQMLVVTKFSLVFFCFFESKVKV